MPLCPLKHGFMCKATAELAIESRCDCPHVEQCDLYPRHDRDPHTESPILVVGVTA